jgi:hypothetical protein
LDTLDIPDELKEIIVLVENKDRTLRFIILQIINTFVELGVHAKEKGPVFFSRQTRNFVRRFVKDTVLKFTSQMKYW